MDTIINPLTKCKDISINMQDILSSLSYKWMAALLIMSIILFIYVMFKNFVKFKPDSKYKWIEKEMDMLVITPAVFILIICITFFTGFKGI